MKTIAFFRFIREALEKFSAIFVIYASLICCQIVFSFFIVQNIQSQTLDLKLLLHFISSTAIVWCVLILLQSILSLVNLSQYRSDYKTLMSSPIWKCVFSYVRDLYLCFWKCMQYFRIPWLTSLSRFTHWIFITFIPITINSNWIALIFIYKRNFLLDLCINNNFYISFLKSISATRKIP